MFNPDANYEEEEEPSSDNCVPQVGIEEQKQQGVIITKRTRDKASLPQVELVKFLKH
ncbi:MAG: hypothetical protein M3P08_17905 [Thermoproteota archaeon]|nr:hypothetical protein [Thermoproteota archaeon]